MQARQLKIQAWQWKVWPWQCCYWSNFCVMHAQVHNQKSRKAFWSGTKYVYFKVFHFSWTCLGVIVHLCTVLLESLLVSCLKQLVCGQHHSGSHVVCRPNNYMYMFCTCTLLILFDWFVSQRITFLLHQSLSITSSSSLTFWSWWLC